MGKSNIPYGIIYLIRNIINNKIYIGQTTEIGGFDRRYKNDLLNYTHNQHLKNAIIKYGIERFEIIKEFDKGFSKDELDKLEDMYIKLYNTTNRKFGYNKQFGGSKGKPTEETRLLMSESAKKRVLKYGVNFKGRKHSEETKRILSKQHIGMKQSEETIKKRVEKNKGQTRNIEIKLKMSESALKSWNKNRKINLSKKMKQKWENNKTRKEELSERTKKTVYCITTGEIFDSVIEASVKYNLDNSSIGKCCRKEQRYCGTLESGEKLIWVFYDNYNEYENRNIIKNIPYHKNHPTKKVINLNTMEIFNSVKEAHIKYKGDISKCCKGKTKSAGKHPETGEKLRWMYYDEYIEQQNKIV